MTVDQPLCCLTCQGVRITQQRSDYTPTRGRLILAHGYCQGRCPEPQPPTPIQAPAEHAATAHHVPQAEASAVPLL